VGAAATVAAVALGSSLIGADQPAPRRTAPAASATAPARAPVAAPAYTTIAPGWLPAGRAQLVLASNGFGQDLRGYVVPAAGGPATSILVGATPGTALPNDYKRGSPRDLQIAGRPGREWSVDDWYYLAILLPQGRVATVDVDAGRNGGKGGDGSAAALAAIGRRVGAHLQTGRHDAIPVDFRLTYLPAGLVVQAVSWNSATGTDYTLAPPTGRTPDETYGYPSVGEVQGSAKTNLKGKGNGDKRRLPVATPGRPVQGHPTWVMHHPDVGGPTYPVLFIDSVRPGVSMVVSGGPVLTDLAELYRIADGLHLL
jgi:hypothetical protein